MLTEHPKPPPRRAKPLLAPRAGASDDSPSMTVVTNPASTARSARIAELLDAVDWAAMTRRLTAFAFLRTQKRSWQLAEDLAQEAIVRLLDPRYLEWDPAREPDLYQHLANLVRGLASNRRRTRGAWEIPLSPAMIAKNTGEDAPDAGSVENAAEHEEDGPARPPVHGAPRALERGPEDQIIRRDLARARDERVAARFAGDGEVLRVFALAKEGTTSLADQAEAMGITMGQVQNARKRLLRGLAAIEQELSGATKEDDDGNA
jgi:DNA-directed RNA polymerase specialized sigma24 family protein